MPETLEQIDALRRTLEAQTAEISRRATELERLRLAEAENARVAAVGNALTAQQNATIDVLLGELRAAIQLLIHMVDPLLRHQSSQVALVLEFVKLMVRREMDVAGDGATRRAFGDLGRRIDEMAEVTSPPERQDQIRRLAVLRGNLMELRLQEAQHGIRKPLDLMNELNSTQAEIEALEQELQL